MSELTKDEFFQKLTTISIKSFRIVVKTYIVRYSETTFYEFCKKINIDPKLLFCEFKEKHYTFYSEFIQFIWMKVLKQENENPETLFWRDLNIHNQNS